MWLWGNRYEKLNDKIDEVQASISALGDEIEEIDKKSTARDKDNANKIEEVNKKLTQLTESNNASDRVSHKVLQSGLLICVLMAGYLWTDGLSALDSLFKGALQDSFIWGFFNIATWVSSVAYFVLTGISLALDIVNVEFTNKLRNLKAITVLEKVRVIAGWCAYLETLILMIRFNACNSDLQGSNDLRTISSISYEMCLTIVTVEVIDIQVNNIRKSDIQGKNAVTGGIFTVLGFLIGLLSMISVN